MKNALYVVLLLVAVFCCQSAEASGRMNSTRKGLLRADTIDALVDTVRIVDVRDFCKTAVTMRGYTKKDSKETFMLTNNTDLYLSRVVISFIYTDACGVLLHERNETIACELLPYSSRMFSMNTFDSSNKFYYIKNRAKKGTVAYNVAIKLIGYDVRITP